MKKIFFKLAVIAALIAPSLVSADQAKGLNVIVNSANHETQAMAMVLSLMSMKKHKKEVNIVLCGPAGDLADKTIQGTPIKRPNGKAPSAKQHLITLIKLGAKVEVCPLYLPNASKDKSILLEGVGIANPGVVAANLLNQEFQNITF